MCRGSWCEIKIPSAVMAVLGVLIDSCFGRIDRFVF